MPLSAEEFQRTLDADGLPAVYLVAGEEPLLQREAVDAVRAAARAVGHTEREVLDVDPAFQWGHLAAAAAGMSLFGDRKLLELRMPGGRPGKDGSAAITEYCQDPPPDTVLLITCNRLERGARESAWVRAVERAGVFVYFWPLPAAQLPGWVAERMRAAGLAPEPGAAELVAERAEGNLLAALQAVEKLLLTLGPGAVTAEEVAAAVTDSARYALDDLGDAALEGDLPRALRVLAGLREEGAQLPLLLWAVARDIRAAARLAAGGDDRVLREEQIWKNRAARVRAAARRRPAHYWQRLLRRCHRVDCAVKGLPPGRPWEELRAVVGAMARAPHRPAGGSR